MCLRNGSGVGPNVSCERHLWIPPSEHEDWGSWPIAVAPGLSPLGRGPSASADGRRGPEGGPRGAAQLAQLVVRGQWSWPFRPPAGTLWPPAYGRHQGCWVVGYELALHTALSPADAVVVGGGAAPCVPSAAPERGEFVSHSATILRGRRFMAPDWGLSRLPSGRSSGIWGLEPVQARRRMLRAHQLDALTRGH